MMLHQSGAGAPQSAHPALPSRARNSGNRSGGKPAATLEMLSLLMDPLTADADDDGSRWTPTALAKAVDARPAYLASLGDINCISGDCLVCCLASR